MTGTASHHEGVLVSAEVWRGAVFGHVSLLSHYKFTFLLFKPVRRNLQHQTLQHTRKVEKSQTFNYRFVDSTTKTLTSFFYTHEKSEMTQT